MSAEFFEQAEEKLTRDATSRDEKLRIAASRNLKYHVIRSDEEVLFEQIKGSVDGISINLRRSRRDTDSGFSYSGRRAGLILDRAGALKVWEDYGVIAANRHNIAMELSKVQTQAKSA